MPILNIQKIEIGVVGVEPGMAYILTDDTVAEITAAGYLNHAMQSGAELTEATMCLVATKTSPAAKAVQVGWFDASYNTSTKNWTLVSPTGPGNVTLPTLANHISVFTDATGSMSDDAATAINGGNIQAGLSGTAGYLSSFPSTSAKGSLLLKAIDNTGDTLVTISNALHGQATVVSIPDGGQATTEFIIADSAGTQTITSGSLALTLGNLTLTDGDLTLTAGSATAGSSGNAGRFISYPGTAANGSLLLEAVNAGGDFNTTISNGTIGQSSTFTLPDPGNTAARILVGATATPFVSGNFPVASGTGGLMVDSGVAASSLQVSTNIKSGTTADIGGAGAGPLTITVAGLTSASVVVATVESSSNAVSVLKATAGTGNFDLTLSGDPGAALLVNYIAFIAAQ